MTTAKPADAAVVLSMGNSPTEPAKTLRTLGTQEGIDPDELKRMVAAMEPGVVVVHPRGTDPGGKPTPRCLVHRLRSDGSGAGGDVAVFWEALCVIRRTASEEIGGWPGQFFLAHECIDIATRLLDAGWRHTYRSGIEVCPSRHPGNPAPVVPLHVGVWTATTMVRSRRLDPLKQWFQGLVEGWQSDAGPRRPIAWKTVATMTRLGRPTAW